MRPQEAITVFENVRDKYAIPEKAKLKFVEKRYIELPDEIDPESEVQVYDEFVWIGYYTFKVRFYELACDMASKIVRFRKSR